VGCEVAFKIYSAGMSIPAHEMVVRRRRAASVIAVVGVAAGFLLVPSGLDDLGWKSTPAVTQVPPPIHCVERSSGDTRCPGG